MDFALKQWAALEMDVKNVCDFEVCMILIS